MTHKGTDGDATGTHGTIVDPPPAVFTKATPPVAFYQSLSKLGYVVSAAWHEGFRGIVSSYNADGARSATCLRAPKALERRTKRWSSRVRGMTDTCPDARATGGYGPGSSWPGPGRIQPGEE